MAYSAPGAQLAPIDLPPPSPYADPREPSPIVRPRQGSRTPQRHRSPAHSRSTSPTRPPLPGSNSAEHTPSSPALHQPIPKSHTSSPNVPIASAIHHHHLSRPSSPSSINSSSSAIFERDIEQPAVASLSLNPNAPAAPHALNHKPSRLGHMAHGTALDQTVPAVLDHAVEALTEGGTSRGFGGLEIESPAPSGMGMARQSSNGLANIGPRKVSTGAAPAFTSRSSSPSPISSPAQSPPILGQLTSQQSLGSGGSPGISPTGGSVPHPAGAKRLSTGQQVPGGWSSGWAGANEVSPLDEKRDVLHESSTPHSPSPPNALPSHLTPNKGTQPQPRRISFISYNDLLLSVPTTVTPLGDITSGTMSPEHLPGTISPHSPVMPTSNLGGHGHGHGGMEHKNSWEQGGSGSGGGGGGLGLGMRDNGEWGRSGLGKGLEQRLEGLVRDER